jgi:hypothetical protein
MVNRLEIAIDLRSYFFIFQKYITQQVDLKKCYVECVDKLLCIEYPPQGFLYRIGPLLANQRQQLFI